jgi:hypothetical protein
MWAGTCWEGVQRKAKVANRTREIRPSGMKRGACGNVRDGSRTAAHRETGWMSHRTLRLRAPHFYPNWQN